MVVVVVVVVSSGSSSSSSSISSSSSNSSLREFALCKLTLSSDPRVWMGGRIPTRWRRYGRDDRDGRLSSQIGCSCLCFLSVSVLSQRNISKLSVLRPFEGRLFTL